MDNILKPHLRQHRRHRNPRFAKSSELKIDVERGCIIIHEKCGGRITIHRQKLEVYPIVNWFCQIRGLGLKKQYFMRKKKLKNITFTGWDRLEDPVSAEDSGL